MKLNTIDDDGRDSTLFDMPEAERKDYYIQFKVLIFWLWNMHLEIKKGRWSYDEKVTPTESYYHMVFGSGIKSCICIRIWDDSNGT